MFVYIRPSSPTLTSISLLAQGGSLTQRVKLFITWYANSIVSRHLYLREPPMYWDFSTENLSCSFSELGPCSCPFQWETFFLLSCSVDQTYACLFITIPTLNLVSQGHIFIYASLFLNVYSWDLLFIFYSLDLTNVFCKEIPSSVEYMTLGDDTMFAFLLPH